MLSGASTLFHGPGYLIIPWEAKDWFTCRTGRELRSVFRGGGQEIPGSMETSSVVLISSPAGRLGSY